MGTNQKPRKVKETECFSQQSKKEKLKGGVRNRADSSSNLSAQVMILSLIRFVGVLVLVNWQQYVSWSQTDIDKVEIICVKLFFLNLKFEKEG